MFSETVECIVEDSVTVGVEYAVDLLIIAHSVFQHVICFVIYYFMQILDLDFERRVPYEVDLVQDGSTRS